MSRFYVGQRVRINCPESADHGTETRVVRLHVLVPGGFSPYLGVEVNIPCNTHPDFPLCVFEEYELEPLTDANQLVSWESMRDLWVPEHLRVQA